MSAPQLKSLVLFAVASLVAGCKLAVIVPSGGDVTSLSGTRNCLGGSLCEFNVTDNTFNESFTAVASPGYVFSKWSGGPGFLCANSLNPTCTANNTGIPQGNVIIDGVIAGGSFFYAMPLFEFIGIDTDGDATLDHLDSDDDNDGVLDVDDNCPLVGPNLDGFGCGFTPVTDTVTVDGREWAQPDLFTNLYWNEINQLCPIDEGGVCKKAVYPEDRLNGYDMDGWVWASMDDVNGLFNYFLAGAGVSGDDLLSGQDYYYGYDYGGWGTAFFDTGFRGTFGPRFLDGLVATLHDCCQAYVGRMQDFDDPEPDVAQVFFYEASSQPDIGAFFYRLAP